MFLKKNLKQNRKFFTLFPLVMMLSIMFPMIHEVSSGDDYLSCTASSGNTGCPKVWLRWVKCHMLQSKLVMFLGKSFTTSEQSGVCSHLQEDPPVPLSLPGYNLPVPCVSSYLHSRVFFRPSVTIFLQRFRNLLLLSVTSFWSSVFRWDKTKRSLQVLLTTSSLILCNIYCTQQTVVKETISSLSHSEPDEVHVFNTAFGGAQKLVGCFSSKQ